MKKKRAFACRLIASLMFLALLLSVGATPSLKVGKKENILRIGDSLQEMQEVMKKITEQIQSAISCCINN